MSETEDARAIARMEVQLGTLVEWSKKVEPILLARSGDLEKMDRFKRDLDELGGKWRTTSARVEDLERRIAKATTMATTVVVILQVVWGLFGDAIRHYLLGAS
ncbi:MAG: hypothetical protein ABI639_17440 [Thermoanaerobaculia bacterium]